MICVTIVSDAKCLIVLNGICAGSRCRGDEPGGSEHERDSTDEQLAPGVHDSSVWTCEGPGRVTGAKWCGEDQMDRNGAVLPGVNDSDHDQDQQDDHHPEHGPTGAHGVGAAGLFGVAQTPRTPTTTAAPTVSHSA